MADLKGDYPGTWDDFIGQDQAKRQLLVATRSARTRGAPLDHVLLASGTPGIGKTSLALLTARELGAKVHTVSGRMTATQARIVLAAMDDGDVLFYDEIHLAVSSGKASAEWLLHLLQDGVIAGPLGAEEQPAITVIGATTDAGRLPETILQRFPLQPVLEPYTELDAARIALKLAVRVLGEGMPLPSPQTCQAIATAANRSPRTMRAILANVRDLAVVNEHIPEDGNYDLSEALRWLGLSEDGLTRLGERYLQALLDLDGTAGERALVDRLQEPGGLNTVERMLMDKGFLAKTKAGRQLTRAGIRRARELQGKAE